MTDGKSSEQTSQRKESKSETLTCESCGSNFEGQVTVYRLWGKEYAVKPNECSSCESLRQTKEKAQEQEWIRLSQISVREKWWRMCGIPEDFQLRRFSNFDRNLRPSPYDIALSWAQGFWRAGPRGYSSLILYSAGPGVGKSHLMAAIAAVIFASWEGDPSAAVCPVRFVSGPGLVRRIRATYNLPPDSQHEREEQVYTELQGVKVLMLDDVGKETPSVHTREVYWYIIDERLKNGLPVVVSTRLGRDALEGLMGEDTVDRLFGMARGKVVTMTGNSYRRTRQVP